MRMKNIMLEQMIGARNSIAVAGLAAIAVLAVHTDARAADLGGYRPPPQPQQEFVADTRPALQWYGLYVGASAGYDFGGREGIRETSLDPFNGIANERWRNQSGGGFTGGGQIGYNVQAGHLVVGVEADAYYANLSRTVASPSGVVTADTTGNVVGSLRGRLGLAAGNWLIYGTGGLALGNQTTSIASANGNTMSASDNATRMGWVAGAGIEYLLDRNWSIRTEFLHTDLGRSELSGVALDGKTYKWRDHITDNAIRFGVNYRF